MSAYECQCIHPVLFMYVDEKVMIKNRIGKKNIKTAHCKVTESTAHSEAVIREVNKTSVRILLHRSVIIFTTDSQPKNFHSTRGG